MFLITEIKLISSNKTLPGAAQDKAFLKTHSRRFVLSDERCCLLTGDPVLPHLEWQSETLALHLQHGERQPGGVAAHL